MEAQNRIVTYAMAVAQLVTDDIGERSWRLWYGPSSQSAPG